MAGSSPQRGRGKYGKAGPGRAHLAYLSIDLWGPGFQGGGWQTEALGGSSSSTKAYQRLKVSGIGRKALSVPQDHHQPGASTGSNSRESRDFLNTHMHLLKVKHTKMSMCKKQTEFSRGRSTRGSFLKLYMHGELTIFT